MTKPLPHARVARIGALFTCLLSTSAWAQAAPAADADEIARVDTERYVFTEGDELDGEVLRPTETHLHQRPGARHPSLIRLRVSFTDRLHRHATDM